MRWGLLRGAAPWLAAGVLVAPVQAALASGPAGRPHPPAREPQRSPPVKAPQPAPAPQGKAPGQEEERMGTEKELEGADELLEEETPVPPGQETRGTQTCEPDERFAKLWPLMKQVQFHPTTLEERAAFATLVPALLKAAPEQQTLPVGLVEVAASVGFVLEVWKTKGGTFWVLREEPGKYRGAGAYVIRTGKATDGVVQVPHPWWDKGTEGIGTGVFACTPEARQPRMLMAATAHRYKGNPGETPEDPEHPADVAHNPEHLFQAVTDLVAQTLAAPRVVQLHGFGSVKDKSMLAVVSSGTSKPSAWARQVSRRLVKQWGEGTRLYPEGTKELGGTKNVQCQLLQAYTLASFLHLEMSARTRESLTSGERLVRLGKVLFEPLED